MPGIRISERMTSGPTSGARARCTPSVSLGGHLVTGLGEQESQRLAETRIIINDQNAHQPPLPVAGTP